MVEKIFLVNILISLSVIFGYFTYNSKFYRITYEHVHTFKLIKYHQNTLKKFYESDFEKLNEITINGILLQAENFNNSTMSLTLDQDNQMLNLVYKYEVDNSSINLDEYDKNQKNGNQKLKDLYSNLLTKEISEYSLNLFQYILENKTRIQDENNKILEELKKSRKIRDENMSIENKVNIADVIVETESKIYEIIENQTKKNSYLEELRFLNEYKYKNIKIFDVIHFVSSKNVKKKLILLNDLIFLLIVINLSFIAIILRKMINKK